MGTMNCRNSAAPKYKLCHKCRKRKQRANDPMKAAFSSLRDSAKERKIPFNLSLSEFAEFAVRCRLLQGRGRQKDSWHVDRIDEDDPRGYHKDNINKASNSENASKENRRRKWEKLRGMLAEAGFPCIKRPPEILDPELIKSVKYEYEPNEFGGYERRGWLAKYPAHNKHDDSAPF
jgi:hypothetical protein